MTHLGVLHSDLEPDGAFLKVVQPGGPMILSSLKSLLETGSHPGSRDDLDLAWTLTGLPYLIGVGRGRCHVQPLP